MAKLKLSRQAAKAVRSTLILVVAIFLARVVWTFDPDYSSGSSSDDSQANRPCSSLKFFLTESKCIFSRTTGIKMHDRGDLSSEDVSLGFRRSSSPYHSMDGWLELATASPQNVTFISSSKDLSAVVARVNHPMTFVIADATDDNNPSTAEEILLLENHPGIRCVYAKNALYSSARLKLIPIGPKWQYQSFAHYGEDKESTWRALQQFGINLDPPTSEELSLRGQVLVPAMGATNDYRILVMEQLSSSPDSSDWLTFTSTNSGFAEYLSTLRSYKFVVSPPGNGRDCHRHWEALLVGTVPIIKRDSALMEAMAQLPVWWVDSYEEVNQTSVLYRSEDLVRAWQEANLNRLYMSWWTDRIVNHPCS